VVRPKRSERRKVYRVSSVRVDDYNGMDDPQELPSIGQRQPQPHVELSAQELQQDSAPSDEDPSYGEFDDVSIDVLHCSFLASHT
jgi:hypothetical protein